MQFIFNLSSDTIELLLTKKNGDIMMNIRSYIDQIPSNTPIQMAIAAGVGFIVETVVSGKPANGVAAAAVSALATAIHGLVSPLFRQLIGRNQLSWGEEMCRTFTGIIGAGCIAKAMGNNSVLEKLMPLAFIYGFITYADPSRRDLSRADWMPIFPRL